MKQITSRLLAALLVALTTAVGLTSCAEHDNPVDPNPLAKQVSGLWYDTIELEGSMPDEYGNGFYDAIVGRGTSDKVAFEPLVLSDFGRNDQEHFMRVLGLEVMVRLQVKLKSRNAPLVYVRHYLPDVKKLDLLYASVSPEKTAKMEEIYQNIKAHQPKGNGVNRTSPAYDYEMERIGKVLKYINKDFKGE